VKGRCFLSEKKNSGQLVERKNIPRTGREGFCTSLEEALRRRATARDPIAAVRSRETTVMAQKKGCAYCDSREEREGRGSPSRRKKKKGAAGHANKRSGSLSYGGGTTGGKERDEKGFSYSGGRTMVPSKRSLAMMWHEGERRSVLLIRLGQA